MIIEFSFFSFLFWGADLIAASMGDQKLSLLLKVISCAFILRPFSSVLRGSYEGRNTMLPRAVIQIFEKIIRVMTILVVSILLLNEGYGAYEAGAGVIFGGITGGIAA